MPTVTAELHHRRPATPRSIATLRRAAVGLATRGGATERQRQDVALAVSEAVTNAVTHAYTQRPVPGPVALHAALCGGTLEVVVADEGGGLPPPALRPRTGLGLAIVARAADGLEIGDATPGTRVRMTFAIG